MHLDVEDVLAGAVGSVIGRSLMFAAAVWLGSSLGAAGIVAGAMLETGAWRGDFGFWLWASPLLLVSYWGILNLAFLLIALVYFVWTDRPGYLAWGVVVGVESLTVMAGWAQALVGDWPNIACAWLAWAILLVMLETGIWLIRQIGINRWARQLGMARAANAQRIARKQAEESTAAGENETPKPGKRESHE